jgi:membrane fusion protein (multidrug efflux system)
MPSPLVTQRQQQIDAIRAHIQRRQRPAGVRNGAWPALFAGMQHLRRSAGTIGKSTSTIAGVIRAASPRRRLLFAAGVVLTGAAFWLVYWMMTGRWIESTDDAYVGGDTTALSFKVAGVIETVAIVDNQAVRAGDLLLKLDDRDYRAQLARAGANVAARRAALVNADATRRMRVAMLGQARADLAAAMAEQVRAKYDIDRYQALSKAQFTTRQRFEQADADHQKASAGERKMQSALEAAEHQLDIVDAQREQVMADLDQAVADYELARLNVSYTEIRSPIDGMVGNRSARAGAYATVGAQLLAIVPAHGLWVDANFRESQLAGMRQGQPAEIVADAIPGVTFHGHVASLAPATGAQFSVIPPENATGNFTKIVQRVPVRILLEDDAAELGQLRPGLSVVVWVDQRQSTGAPVDERRGSPVRNDARPDTPSPDDERLDTSVRAAQQ